MKLLLVIVCVAHYCTRTNAGLVFHEETNQFLELVDDTEQRNDSLNSCHYGYNDDGFYMTCEICSEHTCRSEQCTSNSDFSYLMNCTVCISNNESDAEYKEVCIGGQCDVFAYFAGATMEDSCVCDSVSMDGIQCDYCSFCSDDGINYDLESSSWNPSDFTNGLEFQCPDDHAFNRSCVTFSQLESLHGSSSARVGGIVGAIGLIGQILYFAFMKRRK